MGLRTLKVAYKAVNRADALSVSLQRRREEIRRDLREHDELGGYLTTQGQVDEATMELELIGVDLQIGVALAEGRRQYRRLKRTFRGLRPSQRRAHLERVMRERNGE